MASSELTAAELARAKRCRHFLNWEEHSSGRVSVSSKVSWLIFSGSFVTADDANARFALALRPIIASLAPVLFEEAAKVCEATDVEGDWTFNGEDSVWSSDAEASLKAAAAAIRRLAAGETT